MIVDSWVLRQATISETVHNMGGSSSIVQTLQLIKEGGPSFGCWRDPLDTGFMGFTSHNF